MFKMVLLGSYCGGFIQNTRSISSETSNVILNALKFFDRHFLQAKITIQLYAFSRIFVKKLSKIADEERFD